MKNEIFENVFLKLSSNDGNWMNNLRQNINILRDYYHWSMRVLSEKSGVSEHTLGNIMQGKTKDCDQSLTIKLAKAFGVSVDELIGANTISAETKKTIAMSRVLDDHVKRVICVYAKHQYELHTNKINPKAKEISVITPICYEKKMKRVSLADTKVSLAKLQSDIQEKISFGIKIPCDHYEPHFLKNEIILLGYDREGEDGEMCVISSNGYIYICIKKIQIVDKKKEINYVAITNKRKIFSFDEIDDRFGYVVGFLNPDNSLGVR